MVCALSSHTWFHSEPAPGCACSVSPPVWHIIRSPISKDWIELINAGTSVQWGQHMLSVPRESGRKCASQWANPREGACILTWTSLLTPCDPEKWLCLHFATVGKVPIIPGLQGMALWIKSVNNQEYNYQLYIWNESPLLSVLRSPGK